MKAGQLDLTVEARISEPVHVAAECLDVLAARPRPDLIREAVSVRLHQREPSRYASWLGDRMAGAGYRSVLGTGGDRPELRSMRWAARQAAA